MKRRQISEEVKKIHPEIDRNGRYVAHMNVKDDTDFLSAFSITDAPVISSDVAEYIETVTRMIPMKSDISLRITSSCIDDEEKKIYERAIHAYYLQKYVENHLAVRKNRIVSLFLILVGVIVLAIANELDQLNFLIRSEVIDIFAWVLIWEAGDILLLENRKLTGMEKRYISFINMNIEFIDTYEKQDSAHPLQ
ncbi:MAG: hypothetical protein ACI32N_01645 [Bulleidia sp.]